MGAAADVVLVCCVVVVVIMFGNVVTGSEISATVVIVSSWPADVGSSDVAVKADDKVVGPSSSGPVVIRSAVVVWSSVDVTTFGVVIDSVEVVVIGSVLAADVMTGVVVFSDVVVASGTNTIKLFFAATQSRQ